MDRRLLARPAPRLNRHPYPPLLPAESAAIRLLVLRVLRKVRADLVEAALFGSRARGEARHDSDLDVLLIFRLLPPDREPFAGQAEGIAADVARLSNVPVTVWSVSLIDLAQGNRTPMLVDAMRDAIPIWCRGVPLGQVPFTRPDALRCSRALLERVAEGSEEVKDALRAGDIEHVRRRARDDLVRMCTALLLSGGVTSPRRGDAVEACIALEFGDRPPRDLAPWFDWARSSYGPEGKDEDSPPPPLPNNDIGAVARAVEFLRRRVRWRSLELAYGSNGAGRAAERRLRGEGSVTPWAASLSPP